MCAVLPTMNKSAHIPNITFNDEKYYEMYIANIWGSWGIYAIGFRYIPAYVYHQCPYVFTVQCFDR